MDTIAAISTGNQITAIGILRLSGPEAFAAADAVFRPADGKPLSAHPRRMMVYGDLLDREGRTIDRALAVTFAAGASYTGEDSAEFHCHGSPVVLDEGLATPARTAPSSTATVLPWCWTRGCAPSLPPGPGRRKAASLPSGPF